MEKIIVINKDRSTEFSLFERFALFLANIDKIHDNEEYKLAVKDEIASKKAPGKKPIFYYYVAKKLLDGYEIRTVANFFSENNIPVRINEKSFNFFCGKFRETFDSLSTNQQDYYKAINVAFIEWKNTIYKNNGMYDGVQESEAITSEQNTDTSELNESTSENEFDKAFQVISNFYEKRKRAWDIDEIHPDNAELLFWGSNDCDFEIRQFDKFKSTIEIRNSVLNEKASFQYTKLSLEFAFFRHKWSFYELQGDKIIERGIQFFIEDGDAKEKKHIHPTGFVCQFRCFEENNRQEYSYSCLMDILHKSVQIIGSKDSENKKETIYINLSYKTNHWTLNQCIGHKIIYNSERGTFESKVVVLCTNEREKNEQLFFIKHDLNDQNIPATIRAFLKYPKEMKELGNPYLNLSDTICWMLGWYKFKMAGE